jgi:hypothetical protein
LSGKKKINKKGFEKKLLIKKKKKFIEFNKREFYSK